MIRGLRLQQPVDRGTHNFLDEFKNKTIHNITRTYGSKMDWVLIFISNLGIFKRHNLRMKR
jgi:hypothetical protein